MHPLWLLQKIMELLQKSMERLQKIKNRTTVGTRNFTLGIYLKMKTLTQKEYIQTYVHCNISYNSKDMKTN